MRGFSSWRAAQRIILVIGLGLGLAVLGRYLVSLGRAGTFGWFAYAPLNSTLSNVHRGVRPWLRLVIWLALIGVWTIASFVLLRPADKGIRADGPE